MEESNQVELQSTQTDSTNVTVKNFKVAKKKSVRISRAGVYIKPLLVQCANNAIKDKNCEYFKLRYERIL